MTPIIMDRNSPMDRNDGTDPEVRFLADGRGQPCPRPGLTPVPGGRRTAHTAPGSRGEAA